MTGNLRGVENAGKQLGDDRLWRSLDSISYRLTCIDSQLSEIVRLEERVTNQQETLARHANRLDNHDNRIRQSELWQANQGDKSSVERLMTNLQDEISGLQKKINTLESYKDVRRGHTDIVKEILKWIVGMGGAILVYKITRG